MDRRQIREELAKSIYGKGIGQQGTVVRCLANGGIRLLEYRNRRIIGQGYEFQRVGLRLHQVIVALLSLRLSAHQSYQRPEAV